ncbi:AbrB family transcriptional regulator [Virgibacillus sp. NKC19-3]|uniref:AbrB family transcriptional regulator n=1 Tax=Virgibacillus saliphilus TaxID=2831674 RepID=UPI001C9BAC4F|nr:AbrB family transcriptional regulator [Virgibacillus sp. NKC19-3]MBY7144323.1 AbrB family transcriptional regulator [Virgibacillus sp. NKC19-3]
MAYSQIQRFIETIIIASLGGFLFHVLSLPLPWLLGALTFVMLWQGFTKREASLPGSLKNAGLIIIGIYFGLYFTTDTFKTIWPYFLPYILLTCILILASIMLGAVVTKWIAVDKITSIFASIPGGLTEMTIASEALHAKSAFVVIFQTIRLMTVLFTIPTSMTYLFSEEAQSAAGEAVASVTFGDWNYLWFIFPVLIALFARNKLPAGIIIGALGVTAVMNVSPIELAQVPTSLMNAGQVMIGASLGKNILFRDLKKGGKYCLVYFGLSLVLIIIAFGLGMLLAHFTTLNYATAILSIAPGGLFEMVLTAYNVGGDPAVVSALQLTRILVIVAFVPPLIGWWFGKRRNHQSQHEI